MHPNLSRTKSSALITALIALAQSSTSDEFSKYDKLPTNIREALTKKMEERKAAAANEVAEQIAGLLDKSEEAIKESVENLREARRQEANAKKHIKDIERARQYGLETSNFLPLFVLTGQLTLSTISDLTSSAVSPSMAVVPAGWVSAEESAAS